jgi:hypothetical protein
MSFLGEALGVLTAILFGVAIANFFVKWINRNWVMKLPKEHAFRTGYQSVMKFLVKNHRFFGFGAVVVMISHVVLQILFQWVSITGIVTAGFAVVTIALGVILFKSKKRTPAMLWAHRGAVIALFLAFLVHVITKI